MIHPTSPRSRPQWITALRHLIPMVVLAICCVLLWPRVAQMDMDAIGAAITQVRWFQWALAGLATWCSFQAIGRYDAVWHRAMQTGVTAVAARRAGIRAIAIAQFLGFGAVTASLVRWRCLPSLSLWQATRLSVAVALTFTAIWAGFALAALWWLGRGLGFVQVPMPVIILLLLAALGAIVLARRRAAIALEYRHLLVLVVWTGLDMLFASLALYLLLPAGTGLVFGSVLAAYIVALGVGLISNAPGGAGAFDLTLLALLPLSAPEPLVGAIIAFRVVYYLGPALITIAALARPASTHIDPNDGPATWGLARQTGSLQQIDEVPWLLGDAALTCASIGPLSGKPLGSDIAAFAHHARMRGKTPALYNCDRRNAKLAHDAQWHVRRVAMEAIIRPDTWTTGSSKRQTLRRKLRHADQAGVDIVAAGAQLPLAQMAVIARNWALSHGGEMAFSMGRYADSYVRNQRVFLIRKQGQLIGFVTFQTGQKDWALDLIRHIEAVPDGCIHAAIVNAIETARTEGIARLSLATVPDPRYTPALWSARRAGLIQFKRGFAPIWVPRYHATPTRAGFWISGICIALAVHRPLANIPDKIASKVMMIMQKYQLPNRRLRLKSSLSRDSRNHVRGKEIENR